MLSKEPEQVFTYQARLKIGKDTTKILDDCADLLSRVERHLFADISAGKEVSQLKSEYLTKYKITARQFNAIRVQLEGKIRSIKERQAGLIVETQQKISAVSKVVQKLEKTGSNFRKLHQKKRLVFNLTKKLERLKADQNAGKVRLCFGSKRLFRAQFDLQANGLQSHDEWKAAWERARASSFFFLGSKDETCGNQTCSAELAKGDTFTLRIRLPDALTSTYGKYLFIPGVYFSYGHEDVVNALKACEERKRLKSLKDPNAPFFGTAISYRFVRDKKGWRVFVTVAKQMTPIISSKQNGVIGIDINADHLAVTETDRFGNPVDKHTYPLNTYGKSTNQSKALIGDVSATIISHAKRIKKPLVIEKLDFQKKKAEMKENGNTRQFHR